jgi:hypothetical protein
MLVTRTSWWLTLPPWIMLALCVDAVVARVHCRVRRIPSPRFSVWQFAVGFLAFVFLVGAGAGSVLPSAIIAVILGIKFARSLRRVEPVSEAEHRRLVQLRIGLVVLLVSVAAAAKSPQLATTPDLVDKAVTHNFRASGMQPANWVEEELLSRPDAASILEGRLEDASVGRVPPLLRLHFLLGAPAAVRKATCIRWREKLPHLVPGERLDVFCGKGVIESHPF